MVFTSDTIVELVFSVVVDILSAALTALKDMIIVKNKHRTIKLLDFILIFSPHFKLVVIVYVWYLLLLFSKK